MAQTGQNDSFYESDARVLEFTVTDSDNSGAALSLTGKTLTWKMVELNRYNVPTDTAVLSKSTASGITITSSTGGTLQVSIGSTETASLLGTEAKKTFYHQLEINGIITATGRITILKAV